MFYRTKDNHEILNDALSKVVFVGYNSEIIKNDFANLTSDFKFFRILLVIARSIKLLSIIPKVVFDRSRVYVIREFSNYSILFLSPFLFIARNNIFLNINHNLISSDYSLPIPIKFLCKMGFKFIFFDGEFALSAFSPVYRSNFITPLFPISDRNNSDSKLDNSKFMIVGVVGDMREEKINIEDFEEFLINTLKKPGFKIKLGVSSNNHNKSNHYKSLGVEVSSTYSKEDYFDFLKSLDVLIIFAKSERYYYRHSGTIMDAVSFGVIPIVPNYPIFKSQISNPFQVGTTYQNISELNDVIRSLVKDRKKFHLNFSGYVKKRSELNLLEI